jgi:hypothetical protein
MPSKLLDDDTDTVVRVYGLLAVYLLVCSFWLTIKAFRVSLSGCSAYSYVDFDLGYSEATSRKKSSPTHPRILDTSCWFSDSCNDFDLRYLLHRVLPLREYHILLNQLSD